MNLIFFFLILAFNWKERKALKLDGSVKKEFKARPIGFNFGELNEHFDPSRGDIEVNITNLSDWTEPEISVTNNYKVVDVTRLYGSSKPCGPLVVPRKEYTGRFQRVYKSKGLVV